MSTTPFDFAFPPPERKPMKDKELCEALLEAETDAAVKSLLQAAGFWDAPGAWRPVGDSEANYSIIGAQAADPFAGRSAASRRGLLGGRA